MKPSWDGAPYWAGYLGRDDEGVWRWFEEEPAQGVIEWEPVYGTLTMIAFNPHETRWEESLEKRP